MQLLALQNSAKNASQVASKSARNYTDPLTILCVGMRLGGILV
jgi:hypothetical protein